MRLSSALLVLATTSLWCTDSFIIPSPSPFLVKSHLSSGGAAVGVSMTSTFPSSTSLHLLPPVSTLLADADAVVQEAAKAENGEGQRRAAGV